MLRSWGEGLLRNKAAIEAAFSVAIGSPQPPVPHGVGGSDGPALAVSGKEIRLFLQCAELRAACGGAVGTLVAVLNDRDVSRAGSVTLHDVKVALRAVIPLKSVGAPQQAQGVAAGSTPRKSAPAAAE